MDLLAYSYNRSQADFFFFCYYFYAKLLMSCQKSFRLLLICCAAIAAILRPHKAEEITWSPERQIAESQWSNQ